MKPLLKEANYDLESNDSRNVLSHCLKSCEFSRNYVSNCSTLSGYYLEVFGKYHLWKNLCF